MKYFILAFVVLAIGCTSNPKKDESSQEKTENQEVTVEAEAEATAADATTAEAQTEKKTQDAQSEVQVSTRPDNESGLNENGETTRTFPEVVGEATMAVECKFTTDTRNIGVVRAKGDTPLCGVTYEKFGSKDTIAVANNQVEYCDKVAEQVRGNLQEAGFQCVSTLAQATTPTQATTPIGGETEASAETTPNITENSASSVN